MLLKVRVKDKKVKQLQINLKRLLLHNNTIYIIHSFRSETEIKQRNFLGIKSEISKTYIREIDLRIYNRAKDEYQSIEDIPIIIDFIHANILVMRYNFLNYIKYPLMCLGVNFLKD